MAHYKSNPIVLAVSSIYSQIPHTYIVLLSLLSSPCFPKGKNTSCRNHKIAPFNLFIKFRLFFVIIQKQKLSISSLSELVKKAESPKILLLNFFREIIFSKKLLSRKIQFFTVIIIKCMYIIASRHTNFFILILIDIIFVNFIMGLIIDVRRFIVLI